MMRWSLRTLFVVVALCAVASRVASEAVEFRDQEQGLAGLRGLGPAIVVESTLPTFL
jgi:hypothetical protein